MSSTDTYCHYLGRWVESQERLFRWFPLMWGAIGVSALLLCLVAARIVSLGAALALPV
jgi:hypothetical protein